MTQEQIDTIASATWALLLKHMPVEGSFRDRVWQKFYRIAERRWHGRDVAICVHGKRTVMNYGHAYPLYARRFHHWNQPLVELVHLTQRLRSRPLTFCDIGAGIGDTLLLLDANCPGAIRRVFAVDGDPEFFGYLTRNFGSDTRVSSYLTMLSDGVGEVSRLVRHHVGSSAALGEERVPSTSLDALLAERDSPIDVLKCDVDGFDGKVLAGARRILETDKPNVIFEWHPHLCDQAGTDPTEHFTALSAAGYSRFAWFTKYGTFSHFSGGSVDSALRLMGDLSIRGKHDVDWHYDVVALHVESPLTEVEIAELQFARRRSSRF